MNCSNRLAALANSQSSKSSSNRDDEAENKVSGLQIPKALYKGRMTQPQTCNTPVIKEVCAEIEEFGKGNSFRKPRQNLSGPEAWGLQWLKKGVRDNKLCIIKADKGGAIVLMDPHQIVQIMKEKLENESLYTNL